MGIYDHTKNVYTVDEMTLHGTVRLYGRTVPQHQPYYLFWTGSGLEWNICAGEMWLELDVTADEAEPWVTVEIDGTLFARQMLQPGKQMLCLFRRMNDGNVHRVRFTQDTQASEGTFIAVSRLFTDGEPQPMPQPSMRIEIIGDSISSGEGLALPESYTGWAIGMHSASRAYHRILMQQRDADVRVLSRGGYGVYCGCDNSLDHVMPRYYDAVCGFQQGDACAENDFASWQPDAVIVMLGANDRGACGRAPWVDAQGIPHQQQLAPDGSMEAQSAQRLQDAVVHFLRKLRAKNPQARIIWVCGVFDGIALPVIREAAERYLHESGDSRTEFRSVSPVSDRVSHNHPGPESHRRVAAELNAILDESAQIA